MVERSDIGVEEIKYIFMIFKSYYSIVKCGIIGIM